MIDKLLFVEDDPQDIMIFEKILKEDFPEMEYATVDNSADLRSFLRENDDKNMLVFLDINLKQETGFEIYSNYLKNSKHLVVMLSSSDNPEDKRKALALGIQAYFSKGVSFKESKKILNTVISFYSLNALLKVNMG